MSEPTSSADSAQTRVVDVPEQGRYEIRVGDEVAGFTEYHADGDRRGFPHTVVHEDFQGRGLAGVLIGQALQETRDAGLRVLPQCSAVSGYIRKHPQFVELVPSDRRDEFDL